MKNVRTIICRTPIVVQQTQSLQPSLLHTINAVLRPQSSHAAAFFRTQCFYMSPGSQNGRVQHCY